MSKQDRYDRLYMDIAERIAEMSYAVRNKVGCVMVRDGKILATGWNGMPAGFDNVCEDDEGNTKKEVLHSELNCIAKVAKSTESAEEATLYVTLGTCLECAKLVKQAGVKRLVYKVEYRKLDGIEFLKKAGILVEKLLTTCS